MIRGTKRKMVETPTKRFDVGASIHNRFDIEVVDAVSGKVKQKVYAENVICDKLWSLLLSGGYYNAGIHYGDGLGTPSSSDTSLFSFIAYKESTLHDARYDYDTNVYSVTKKAVIPETEAIGKTITEIGIAINSTKTDLVTHAMLRDMNGNSVSLVKTDTDIFNIYATIFVHFNIPSGVRCLGTILDLHGTNFLANGYLAHISGLVDTPTLPRCYISGGYEVSSFGSTSYKSASITYDTLERSMTVKCNRLGASEYNDCHGIKTIYLGKGTSSSYPGRQFVEFAFEVEELNGWYSKTTVLNESLGTGDGVTTDFSTKINFAKNAVIKVDSIPVDSVVDYGYPEDIGHYFRCIRQPAQCASSGSGSITPTLPMYQDGTLGLRVSGNIGGDLSKKTVYENVLYQTHGVKAITGSSKQVYVSNDLSNWIDLGNGVSIAEEYQHYRYWILHCTGNSLNCSFTSDPPLLTKTNVHLTEAPPEGAVITADYDAICVGKDENHVFDFSVTFQFNEYTEAQ